MKWTIGILVAPRPVATVGVTVESIRKSWEVIPYCFAEPGSEKALEGVIAKPVLRPSILESGTQFEVSPEGRFGNFQNWLQAAADLLAASGWSECSDNDPIMICEDDALLTCGILEYIESCLWPSEDCGVVSLYCPPLKHYQTGRSGLCRTRIVHSGETLTRTGNLVGALALIFPIKVLRDIVNHPSQSTWGGSHAQLRDGCNAWDRKAVDTWIGRTLLQIGRTAWHFVPSLVTHYAPLQNVSNSSMGNGFNRGPRQSKNWMPVLDERRLNRPRKVFSEVR